MTDEDQDSANCPVCGRAVCLNEDGTLWFHFMSFLNQDDPESPFCPGSEMTPLEAH